MSIGYRNNFEEIGPIGAQSSITTIFEARSLNDNKRYAIKKIPFSVKDENSIVNEIKLLSRLNKDYIVRFIDIWVESNYYISGNSKFYSDSSNILMSPDKTRLMHIQMNLYSLPLDRVVQLLNYSAANVISPKKYSIASEIFVQLLECVQYLHNSNPPIIHKNLKSENIMLTEDSDNRNVKLTDFGLSTYYDVVNEWHSTRKGIKSNCPPEVNRISYTDKTDMYSIGIIMKELFNIDIEKKFPVITTKIQSHYGIIRNICLKCLSPTATIRPSCEEVLSSKDAWLYSIPKTKSLLSEISKLETKNQVKAEEILVASVGPHAIQKQKSIEKPVFKNLTADDIGLPYNFVHVLHIGHNSDNNTQPTEVKATEISSNTYEIENLEETDTEKGTKNATNSVAINNTSVETQNEAECDKQEIQRSLQTEEVSEEGNVTNTVLIPIPRKRIASKDSNKLSDNEKQADIECDSTQIESKEEVLETAPQYEPLSDDEHEDISEVYRIETLITDTQTTIAYESRDKLADESENSGVYQNDKQNGNNKDRKLTINDIGLPFNFVHVLHVGHDFNNNKNNKSEAPTQANDINMMNDKEILTETYKERLLSESQSDSVTDKSSEKSSDNDCVAHQTLVEDIIVNEQSSPEIINLNECEVPSNGDNNPTDSENNEISDQISDVKILNTESNDHSIINDSVIRDDVLSDDVSQSASIECATIGVCNETLKSVPPPIYPRKSKIISTKESV